MNWRLPTCQRKSRSGGWLWNEDVPATKSIPKEPLPIIDRPILDYIVAAAIASGIEHTVIITGRMKGAIEDYFDRGFELDVNLRNAGKHLLANRIAEEHARCRKISFVRREQLLPTLQSDPSVSR